MAREASRRYEHFYKVFMASSQYEHEFTAADCDSYREADEFSNWFRSLAVGSETWARAADIRTLRPTAKPRNV